MELHPHLQMPALVSVYSVIRWLQRTDSRRHHAKKSHINFYPGNFFLLMKPSKSFQES